MWYHQSQSFQKQSIIHRKFMSKVLVSSGCSWHVSSLIWPSLLSQLVHCSQDVVSLYCVSELLNPWSCESYVVYLYIQLDLSGSSCWVVAQSIGQLHLMCLVHFWWSCQISVTLGAFSADEEGHWPSSSWQSSLMVCDHSLLWNSFPVDMWWGAVGIPSLYIHEAFAGKGNELVFFYYASVFDTLQGLLENHLLGLSLVMFCHSI